MSIVHTESMGKVVKEQSEKNYITQCHRSMELQ